MQELPRFAEAKEKEKLMNIDLQSITEIAWKFVIQPNPVIVIKPETYDDQLHERYFGHWDKSQSRSLIYVTPVVFRSYHGVLMKKGLVGNSETKLH